MLVILYITLTPFYSPRACPQTRTQTEKRHFGTQKGTLGFAATGGKEKN
jgi:hypothetical protein